MKVFNAEPIKEEVKFLIFSFLFYFVLLILWLYSIFSFNKRLIIIVFFIFLFSYYEAAAIYFVKELFKPIYIKDPIFSLLQRIQSEGYTKILIRWFKSFYFLFIFSFFFYISGCSNDIFMVLLSINKKEELPMNFENFFGLMAALSASILIFLVNIYMSFYFNKNSNKPLQRTSNTARR